MSRVVFISWPASGHCNPTIGLFSELVNRGEEVYYYATEELRPKIESTGATFCGYHLENLSKEEYPDDYQPVKEYFDIRRLTNICNDEMAMWSNITQGPNYDLKNEIIAHNPDYIIHDSTVYWGKNLAKQLNLPAIASVTTFAYCDRMMELFPEEVIREILTMPEEYVQELKVTQKTIGRISKMIGNAFNMPDYNCIDRHFCQEALNIVYTSKEFQPFSNYFDSRFKFVGPSIYPRKEPVDFPLEHLTPGEVILISLGSHLKNVQFYRDFYKVCMAAFGDTDKQVVMTIGQMDQAVLGEIPRNFIIRPFVPQLEILQKSALFISHGGPNSVNEALNYNVPVIAIPQLHDQFYVAKRVAELKVGIRLENPEVNVQSLREAAHQILTNPIYAANAKQIGESLRSSGGYRRAADEIFQFKTERGIR
ncbi:MAG TPA: macrolide family glycosyltransferase [Bacillota bacterium]|nr:macrolide family glycosyltransferase [Bacillota bacterium]